MIVKIFQPSASFNGVRYNIGKVEKDKGELVKTANFGTLQGLDYKGPSDYIKYLEAWSSTSARIKYPQLHVAISCKGRSHSKEQLTEIAEKWLNGMGYGEQPYLLVFHKDTNNNHIHIVSTRVDKDGHKINDSFEKLRAYQVLNQVMGMDEKQQTEIDVNKALSYNFTTRAQFMMLLELQGYALKLLDTGYQVSKFGKQLGTVELAAVDARIRLYSKNINRLTQLRAIVEKYRTSHDPAIIPVTEPLPGGRTAKPTAYTSELAQLLAEKFGIQILFHGTTEKPPYGYTLIDHANKTAYKGNDLMPIAEFIRPLPAENPVQNQPEQVQHVAESTGQDIDTMEPNIVSIYTQELEETGIEPAARNTTAYSAEPATPATWLPEINLDISDDIDDEAILGRNRQRKRKARTNTR